MLCECSGGDALYFFFLDFFEIIWYDAVLQNPTSSHSEKEKKTSIRVRVTNSFKFRHKKTQKHRFWILDSRFDSKSILHYFEVVLDANTEYTWSRESRESRIKKEDLQDLKGGGVQFSPSTKQLRSFCDAPFWNWFRPSVQ